MKQTIRAFALLTATLAVAGCVSPTSRNLPLEGTLSVATKGAPGVIQPNYDVTAVKVSVPETLRVSEANMFYPLADIVWRGDAPGNRYEQVKSIMEEGLNRGVASLHSGRPVTVEVEMTRFHSLTEKTRYTIGGTHSVHFILTVRDTATGAVVDGPRPVVADVKGAGGSRAVAEEQAGRTMRVVITEHVAQVIRQELSQPVRVKMPEAPAVSQNAAPAVATVARVN